MATLLGVVCAREYERLKARRRPDTVADALAAAPESSLVPLLRRLPPQTSFTLGEVVRDVLGREGTLSQPEAILLFLHQFDDLFLREQREQRP